MKLLIVLFILLDFCSFADNEYRSGLGLLFNQNFMMINGHKVALFTDGRLSVNGRSAEDYLLKKRECILKKILCTHDAWSTVKAKDRAHIIDSFDERMIIQAVSECDDLIFCFQDTGYADSPAVCWLNRILKLAGGKRVIVADSVNPMGADIISGPLVNAGNIQIAYRHGMTIGEIARLFVSECYPDTRFVIAAMGNFSRSDSFETRKLHIPGIHSSICIMLAAFERSFKESGMCVWRHNPCRLAVSVPYDEAQKVFSVVSGIMVQHSSTGSESESEIIITRIKDFSDEALAHALSAYLHKNKMQKQYTSAGYFFNNTAESFSEYKKSLESSEKQFLLLRRRNLVYW